MNTMMKTINKLASLGTLILFLMLTLMACSSSDEDTTGESPVNPPANLDYSEYLQPGTDEIPDWMTADDLYHSYEQTMSVQVTLQNALQPYLSADDKMCVTVNDEIRAVCLSPRYSNGEWTYSLVIAGSGNDKFLSLSYYCSKLKRIYTMERWMVFSQSAMPTEVNGRPYVVSFFREKN